ncbi:hypothetical protein ACJX0J_031364 [Zea mays]
MRYCKKFLVDAEHYAPLILVNAAQFYFVWTNNAFSKSDSCYAARRGANIVSESVTHLDLQRATTDKRQNPGQISIHIIGKVVHHPRNCNLKCESPHGTTCSSTRSGT